MASELSEIAAQITENVTESTGSVTKRVPSTPEGMAIAYGSLIVMAIVPIFFGSYRAVKHHKEQQQQCKETGKQPETMTRKEAMMFPFISSFILVGLYLVYKILPQEYVKLLLVTYFFFLGILALCHLTSPVISSLVPAAIPKTQYHILFTQGEGDKAENIIDYKFNLHDIVCLVCCSFVGAWYVLKKHWIANNLFGIAFAINGVELLHLNNVITGCILLCGLLLYDAFWVFGTDVMVTVANAFEVPIKLVFPQDLLEKGLTASNFAMLGLAVPACLGTPLLLAAVKGDFQALFSYEDHPKSLKETEKPAQTQAEMKKAS
ncbi:Minor histocompatibility antigen H13 [Dufourea novaeangliae]|uniref:Minor histocompatibility antigen H13 n=1 Tax=Dufourea novaeangliae TaxID=178035 RepID=A0A154PMA7_DUFNO|nr:Minor histocompatibility antigen H13 [Dufourea novaeangliae]